MVILAWVTMATTMEVIKTNQTAEVMLEAEVEMVVVKVSRKATVGQK